MLVGFRTEECIGHQGALYFSRAMFIHQFCKPVLIDSRAGRDSQYQEPWLGPARRSAGSTDMIPTVFNVHPLIPKRPMSWYFSPSNRLVLVLLIIKQSIPLTELPIQLASRRYVNTNFMLE